MQFGLMYSFVAPPGAKMSHLDTFREMDRLVPLAEELGFGSFQTTEHHFQNNGWAPSPLLLLAHAAGLAKHMRLVANVLLLPLYHPLRLAEDVATLDNISNGRLTLGVSPGYVSEECTAYEISYLERFKRSEEILDILQASWQSDELEFEGEFYRIPRCRIMPRPVQRPIPIWYGVSGPKLLRRAALRRCPVTASPRHTNTELQEHYRRYDAAAAEVGFATKERPIIRELFVAPTLAEAEEIAGPAIMELFGLYGRKSAEGERQLRNDAGEVVKAVEEVNFRTFASRYIVGDPDMVIEQLKQLERDLSPTEVICRMQLPLVPTAKFEQSLRLFGEAVMPAFS
jgi:alkanesulfonate monooxygenase SsuD/methylene tetrahydromethanopterin reductase-like flavin-dependent oxidoreductase (luciferase family)